MKKYKYFLSFAHVLGFSNCIIELDNKITDKQDLLDITNKLAEEAGMAPSSFCVLYFTLVE